MKNVKLISIVLAASCLITSCELHDDLSITTKRKAIVHMVYHYENGREDTLEDVEAMRLFIYDHNGDLYRDTALEPEEFLQDTGAMQTYLSNGHYSLISWANVGKQTEVATEQKLSNGALSISSSGADCLMYGRCDTPIAKGDSLRFDIYLFKSVFKVNVQVKGLQNAVYPEDHYFGIMNRSSLTIDNRPSGDLKLYRPELTYYNGNLTGVFYMPYYLPGDDFTVGVYCDNPLLSYTTLCQATIRDFSDYQETAVGKDFLINVDIIVNEVGASIQVTDWEGRVIQDEQIGN